MACQCGVPISETKGLPFMVENEPRLPSDENQRPHFEPEPAQRQHLPVKKPPAKPMHVQQPPERNLQRSNSIPVEPEYPVVERKVLVRNATVAAKPPSPCINCKGSSAELDLPLCEHRLCNFQCLFDYVFESTNGTFENLSGIECRLCGGGIPEDWLQDQLGDVLGSMVGRKTIARKVITIDCPIWMETVELEDSRSLPCDHAVCVNCLKEFMEEKITSRQVGENQFTCPCFKWDEEIPTVIVDDLMDKELRDKYHDFRMADIDLEGEDEFLKHCPAPGCEFAMIIPKDAKEFKCYTWGLLCCPQCNEKIHDKLTCEEFAALKNAEKQEGLSKNELKKMGFKACPRCKVPVELGDGCKFMRCESHKCKAKTYFCFLCEKKMKLKHHYSHYKINGPFGNTCNTIDGIPDE